MNDKSNITVSIPHMEHYAFTRQYDLFHSCVLHLLKLEQTTENLEEKYAPLDENDATDQADSTEQSLELVRSGLKPLREDMSLEEREFWYGRLATAITVYLADPTYDHSAEQLFYIDLLKPTIQTVFFISHYRSMDHILWHRNLINDGGSQLSIKTYRDLLCLLSTHSIHSNVKFDTRQLANTAPDEARQSYIAALTRFQFPFDDQAQANLERLVQQHEVMEQHTEPKVRHVLIVVLGWMMCSYWDIDNRHRFKASANRMMRNWLDNTLTKGVKKQAESNCREQRPIKRIVVASESYASDHAMYRSYHGRIEALKEHYETILVTCKRDYDETSARDFHEVAEVPETLTSIEDTVKTILRFEPDLILYPSLGMAHWTTVLCNMRLAPIQMMSYGHPASAFTDTVDYGVIGGIQGGPDYQAYLNETLAPQRLKARPHTIHPQFSEELKQQPPEDLIQLCASLERQTARTLEFHFFPAKCVSTARTALEKSLAERLSSRCIVHPLAPYRDYMMALGQCTLSIGTFPFGGTNTNVDTLLLGIPKFFYTEGSDIASFTDVHELDALGLAEDFNSNSEDELLATLLKVVESPQTLEYYRQKLRDSDIRSLINNTDPDDRDQFVQALRWVAEQEGVAE